MKRSLISLFVALLIIAFLGFIPHGLFETFVGNLRLNIQLISGHLLGVVIVGIVFVLITLFFWLAWKENDEEDIFSTKLTKKIKSKFDKKMWDYLKKNNPLIHKKAPMN